MLVRHFDLKAINFFFRAILKQILYIAIPDY
jgi:hypothetical protein